MPIAHSARVHPTALIDPDAEIGPEVQVGPHVVVEGPVRVGAGCVLRNGAHLIGPLTMGGHNVVHSYAVLGDAPQHLRYNGAPSRLEIGEQNVFREHVTVHRAATPDGVTRIGNRNFLMACSHVGHDVVVGNNCVLVNGALVGGHAVIQDNALLSGGSAVHQFTRVGRLALLGGLSGVSMDLPPFMIAQAMNAVAGVNVIGMRRAGLSNGAIDAVRRAFHVIFRSGLLLRPALAQVERDHGHVPEVAELVAFVRASKRGISLDCDRQAA